MTTSKLSLYNGALRLLGARGLSALTDNVESRRVLDEIWDDNAIDYCLARAYWKFALRSVEVSYDPSYTASFGYKYRFTQLDDYIKLAQFSNSEYFSEPYLQYLFEGNSWFCDLATIYMQYVSNDETDRGGDLSSWPESFTRYFECYLAKHSRERIAKNGITKEEIEYEYEKTLRVAKSEDAMEDPTKFLPQGSWVRARRSGNNRNGSRWNGR